MIERPSLSAWLAELRTHFPIADEFRLADAIYPFATDYENGLTPQQSYDRFDLFVSCEEV